MKKKLKTMLKMFLILTSSVFFLTLTGCGNKNTVDIIDENEDIKVNTNNDITKDQNVDVFKLTNTSLVYENGTSTLVTTVQNTSSKTQYIKSFNIIIKDKEGNVLTTMLGYIGEEIFANETREITSSSDLDLSNAKSIDYTINK